ncbi:MAG: response regulator [Bacteroidota bacterium]|nr:response regulator [Bacteroidota bacterium]
MQPEKRLNIQLWIGFLGIILGATLLGTFTYRSFQKLMDSTSQLGRTDYASAMINELFRDIMLAENQLQSYILTDDPAFAESYTQQVNKVTEEILYLKLRMQQDSLPTDLLDSLQFVFGRKIDSWEYYLELRQESKQGGYSRKALKDLREDVKKDLTTIDDLPQKGWRVEPLTPKERKLVITRDPIKDPNRGLLERLFADDTPQYDTVTTFYLAPEETVPIPSEKDRIKERSDSVMVRVVDALQRAEQEEQIMNERLSDQEMVLLGEDRAILDRIRELVFNIQAEASVRFARQMDEARHEANEAMTTLFILLFSGVFMGAVLMFLIFRELGRARFYRQKLETEQERVMALSGVKEEFITNITHELRSPLNAVIGFAERLSRTKLEPDQEEQVHALRSSASFLQGIVNDILDLARINSGEMTLSPRWFKAVDFVKDLERIYRPQAEGKDLGFSLEYPESIENMEWFGDSFRWKQILVNLLQNAIKFTRNGEISLKVTLDGQDQAHFEVGDTGIGIAPERLKRIFDSFLQEDDSIPRDFGGTGLGLSISQKLATLMGGRIEVESEKGKGSRFKVILPLRRTRMAREEERKEIVIPTLGNRSIWVVEDDPLNALLLKNLLEPTHCSLRIFQDPNETLRASEEELPDILLTDLKMPGLTGQELVRRIREAYSETRTRFIALSAQINPGDDKKLKGLGFDEVLAKPFTPEGLYQILDADLVPSAARPQNVQIHKGPHLQELTIFAGGDEEALRDIAQTLYENLVVNMEVFHYALQKGDLQQMAGAAHKLAPSLDHIGLGDLSSKLRELEVQYHKGGRKNVERMGYQLLPELREAKKEVKKVIP